MSIYGGWGYSVNTCIMYMAVICILFPTKRIVDEQNFSVIPIYAIVSGWGGGIRSI